MPIASESYFLIGNGKKIASINSFLKHEIFTTKKYNNFAFILFLLCANISFFPVAIKSFLVWLPEKKVHIFFCL